MWPWALSTSLLAVFQPCSRYRGCDRVSVALHDFVSGADLHAAEGFAGPFLRSPASRR